jgi:hypothetical protein
VKAPKTPKERILETCTPLLPEQVPGEKDADEVVVLVPMREMVVVTYEFVH